MIKKLKRVIVDEIEVVQFTKGNILEVAMFLGIKFKDDNDMFEFKEEVLKQNYIPVNAQRAFFENYIVKDNKGNLSILDEIGYMQLEKEYKEYRMFESSNIEEANRYIINQEEKEENIEVKINKEQLEEIVGKDFANVIPVKIKIGSNEIKALSKMAQNLLGEDGTDIINNLFQKDKEIKNNNDIDENIKKVTNTKEIANTMETFKNLIELGKNLKDILK